MATEQELKAQLRAKIKGNLAHVSAASIESQSIAAQNVILSMPEYTRAKSVGIYLCMPTSEAQTYALIRDAFKQDKAVFVPYIHAEVKADDMESAGQVERSKPAKKRKVMSMLRLNSLHEYENLKPDSWNIPTLPKSDLETRENANGGKGLQGFTTGEATGGLDLIVMPGVAFDHQMNRMGHGAGYYDKFLASFCKAETRQKPFLGKIMTFSFPKNIDMN
jgi:5-formyltetrahydrofolate cyclo-ligase